MYALHMRTLAGGGRKGPGAQGSPIAVPRDVQLLPTSEDLHLCPRRPQVQECQTENG